MLSIQKLDTIAQVEQYINEIKPYHTKVVDTVITYTFKEVIIGNLIEKTNTTIDLFFDDREYNKHGFEHDGFSVSGLDIRGNYISPGIELDKNGYDMRIYDKSPFDLVDDSDPSIDYQILRGLDDYGLEETELDERKLFNELDEIGLDLCPLDDGNTVDYGLDDNYFDINTFDDVYENKSQPTEGFVNTGYKSTTYGDLYGYDNNFIDQLDEPSATTIRATFTEKLVIDKARQQLVGFDYIRHDTEKFDTIPANEYISTTVGFNLADVNAPISTDEFGNSVRLVPVSPGTKEFEIRNVDV